jgi:hypothetical protein
MSEQPKNARALNALTYEQRLNHPRRCTARRQRDGKPCGRFAIRGGSVCHIHGGASPQVIAKAKERMGFAKALMLERAVRGLTPDPSMSAADKRLAKAMAKEQGKPGPRRATRPAGPPPTQPASAAPEQAQKPAETQPERAPSVRTPVERPAPLRPAFAEPSAPPKRGLSTLEDAVGDVATANRRAGVTRARRRRR